jgi:quercetin dioxygenase-like cupin family protein
MGVIDAAALPELEPKPGWHGRFFHSEHMTFAYYAIDAGASLHEHHHKNEEVWHVLEGAVELTLDGQTATLHAGQAAVIPSGTTHAAASRDGCRVIVVDLPSRHEIAGTPI